MERVACNLCGSERSETRFVCRDLHMGLAKGDYSVVSCLDCGLLFLNPRPSPEELRGYYPESYYAPAGGFLSAVRRAILRAEVRRFRGALGPSSRVLELGCGTGEFLSAFRKEFGCSTFGVEPSPFAAGLAVEGGASLFPSLEAAAAAGPYDLVIMKHVLEHLPDPMGALRLAAGALAPGGRLYVWLPLAGTPEQRLFGRFWHGFDAPRHLYAFSAATLSDALRRAGLEPEIFRKDFAPNTWAASLRNLLTAAGLPAPVRKIFDDERSPLPLALFFPVNALLALAGAGGRAKVLAARRP